MPTYAVNNPQTYDLMELQGKAETPMVVIEYLSGKSSEVLSNEVYASREKVLSLLDFDVRKRKMSMVETFGIESYAQQYVANQIVAQDENAAVVLTDGRRRTLSQVDCDAVFTTTMSSNFPTAVAESIILNRAKIPVILGGIHVSTSPNDVDNYVRQHVPHPDLVSHVVGAGDSRVIKQILQDLQRNELQHEYTGNVSTEDGVWGNSRIEQMERMKMDLLTRIPIFGKRVRDKMSICPVSPFVGCPYSCDFCSIGGLDKDRRRQQARDPDDFVAELQWLQQRGERFFFFLPDNLLLGGKKLDEMLDKIIDSNLNINFFAQISIEVADKPELLEKMRRVGATHFFIGFESLNLENLRHVGKNCVGAIERSGGNVREYYLEKIRKIQDHGISIHGAFIVGLPHDFFNGFDDHTGIEIAEFCAKNHIGLQCTALTDLPGSRQFARSIEEGTHLFGKPGSMDYLTGLCLTDLTESNRVPPESLHNSPLVVTYIGYDAIKRVGSTKNALRSATYMAAKALQHPIGSNSRSRMDRLLIDPALAFGSQLVVSQFKDHGDGIVYSSNGRKGAFQRLYESEINPEVRQMFANVAT